MPISVKDICYSLGVRVDAEKRQVKVEINFAKQVKKILSTTDHNYSIVINP